jgi:hypothetical protein
MSARKVVIGPLDALAAIRATARGYWYTIAVHGSLSRDIDLIAVPWVQIPGATPAELVAACVEALGVPCLVDGPEEKFHRRQAWSIRVPKHNWYIDLSVITPDTTVHDFAARYPADPVLKEEQTK